MKHLRIGTRGSLLAKWQAEFVRKQIFQTSGIEGEIVIIKNMRHQALYLCYGKHLLF